MVNASQSSDNQRALEEAREYLKEATRLSIDEILEQEGYDTQEDMLAAFFSESVVPAMCNHGCQIEQDGTCVHGNNSIISEILGI